MTTYDMNGSTAELPFSVVLLTGAAGFVGSRLLDRLANSGATVIAVDDLSVGLPMPVASSNIQPVIADIRNAALMRAIFADYRPQAMIHLAALHHIPTCEANPYSALDINVMGTQVLLEVAGQEAVENVILASSGAVYDWSEGSLSEDHSPLKARDIYATTKLTNEYQLATWCDRTGFRGHIARIFNVIGLNDPNGHLIPDILKQIIASRSDDVVIKLGNTSPKRDYVYVNDVADALFMMLNGMYGGPAKEIFNISTGEEESVAELVGLIGEIVGRNIVIEQDQSRIRKIDRVQQLGNPLKMQTAYGWKAKYNTRQVLEKIVHTMMTPSSAMAAE